jgi:hypothetical protein
MQAIGSKSHGSARSSLIADEILYNNLLRVIFTALKTNLLRLPNEIPNNVSTKTNFQQFLSIAFFYTTNTIP